MKNHTIIVLDDSLEHLAVMEAAAQKIDCTTFLTQDFHEAIRLCAEHEVDILISDLNMGERNGFDFMEEIQSHCHSKMINRIIYSSDSPSKNAEKMAELNIVGWIVKPANQDAVIDTINNILSRL